MVYICICIKKYWKDAQETINVVSCRGGVGTAWGQRQQGACLFNITLILLVFENGKSINIQDLLKIKFEIIISIHLIQYLLDLSSALL